MGEDRYTLVAAASFGLEAVVRSELSALGYADARAVERRVHFEGAATDVARCNIRLRAADRLLVRLAEFPAADFDVLFEGVRSIRWRDFLPRSPRIVVEARTTRSALASAPAIQSIAKKAIVDAISAGRARIEEAGPLYSVEIVLSRDQATVFLDTTGPGLHKRGYRTETGEAPIRENLAAALVLLSRWEPPRPFADPLCGSGTIPIEAALIAWNVAPGIARSFAAESWPHISARAWSAAREEARDGERRDREASIAASDRDGNILGTARRNTERAGVAGAIRFERASLEAFRPEGEYGCMVCNPPYGERLGGDREVQNLYRAMGRLYRGLQTWSFFALSSHEGFQKHFGLRASRNRKLYNGSLRCYYYQYFGPLPPRA